MDFFSFGYWFGNGYDRSSYKDFAHVFEVRRPVCWPIKRDTMG